MGLLDEIRRNSVLSQMDPRTVVGALSGSPVPTGGLAYGIGQGLGNQAINAGQFLSDPHGYQQRGQEMGRAYTEDPIGMMKGVLGDVWQRATSSPQGLGEVIGENLSPRVRAPRGLLEARPRVEKWYDKYSKSWVVQRKDASGNQIGDSDYVYSKREAKLLEQQYQRELAEAEAAAPKRPKGLLELDVYHGTPHVFEPEFSGVLTGEGGKPLTVYHGTGADFDSFKSGGAYFSADPGIASDSARAVAEGYGGAARVMPAHLRMKKPAMLSTDEIEGLGYNPERVAELRALGYDGARNESGSEFFAFDPEQVVPKFSEPDAPHGKFKLSEVGKGEGAQVYGHGIYLAENPNTANYYRKNLSDWQPEGVELPRPTTASYPLHPEERAMQHMAQALDDVPEGLPAFDAAYARARRSIRQEIKEYESSAPPHGWADTGSTSNRVAQKRNAVTEALEDALKTLNDWQLKNVTFKRGGALYKADLADEAIPKMMDWQKPLGEQPEVLAAMREAFAEQASKVDPNYTLDQYLKGLWSGHSHMTAEKVPAGQAYKYLSNVIAGGPAGASQALMRKGVPGVKYWDQMSRMEGQGTRNFVLFEPELAKIIGRE